MSETTPSPIPTTPAASPSRNYLSKDVEIKGNITFRTDATIDGKVEGEISSAGAVLTLGENAEVHGEIKTRSVIVRGSVNGNITVSERCELRGNAELVGDLKATQLVMEEDATLVGRADVNPRGHGAASGASDAPASAARAAGSGQQGLLRNF